MRARINRVAAGLMCAVLALSVSAGRALCAVCLASASGVAFAGYDPTASSPNTSAGTVTVSCTTLTSVMISYSIALGTGVSASYAPREMRLLSNLNYNLYTSATLSQVWGDGTAGTATVSDSYTLTTGTMNRSYNVYGAIPAGQNVPAGAYLDTIIVTVTY